MNADQSAYFTAMPAWAELASGQMDWTRSAHITVPPGGVVVIVIVIVRVIVPKLSLRQE